MKCRNTIAILFALLTACLLVSCGQHAEESTHSSLSADTTSAPREIETPICTEEYVEPTDVGGTTGVEITTGVGETTEATDAPAVDCPGVPTEYFETTANHVEGTAQDSSELDPQTDDFDYSTLSLPDFAAENPVRYMDEDEMLGPCDGWQDFDSNAEIQTIAQPIGSTYTYQMYSYYIRNDIIGLYRSAGITPPDTVLWLSPQWPTDTTSDGSRLLWYSMNGTLPDSVTLVSSEEIANASQTHLLFRAHYKVTEGDITQDWLLYFTKTTTASSLSGNNAAVFAVQVHESFDTVINLADRIAKSYRTNVNITELAYDEIFYYQYAADLHYYSCMYLTPCEIRLWNTQTEPNFSTPSESEGFDTAYIFLTDPVNFASVVNTAVEKNFEAIDAEIVNEPFFDHIYPPNILDPRQCIAVYKDGQMLQMVGNTAASISGEAGAYYSIRGMLNFIRSNLSMSLHMAPADQTPKITAILQYEHDAQGGIYAKYFTENTVTSWNASTIHTVSPLDTPDMQNKEISVTGALPQSDVIKRLPIKIYAQSRYSYDDDVIVAYVFYLEDGSIYATSCNSMNESLPEWNTIDYALNTLWESRTPRS